MKRKILIIDDNKLEITLLKGFLSDEYEIIEALNGKEGLKYLETEYESISVILLDIIMPEMDGYEVLKEIRLNDNYHQIPIIITTSLDDIESQEKAIKLGANEFIIKPFTPHLLLNTIQNAIKLSEAAAIIKSNTYDSLTGLYNRDHFLKKAEHLIKEEVPGNYILSCLDINKFKIINNQYGTEKGNDVLKHVANCLNEFASKYNCLVCRYMADEFAILYDTTLKDCEEQIINHRKIMDTKCIDYPIHIRIGRYQIFDRTISVSSMFDRACMAKDDIRDSVEVYVCDYNSFMLESMIHEQKIINEMKKALTNHEFVIWLQPQYNHSTGALIGSEALVRWKKDNEFISPAEFIPIFERNGFIYDLDQYVWEETCKVLRKWLDEGKNPLPVSVNISRRDFFHKHFISVLTGIIDKYEIPYNLIRLEVTESAFAEANGLVTRKVNQLIYLGFTVEIDDFGSGYSSLNTLKDVNAQILKLDMKFFEKTKNNERSGNIIESVVRMAKWLGMAVIAEVLKKKNMLII